MTTDRVEEKVSVDAQTCTQAHITADGPVRSDVHGQLRGRARNVTKDHMVGWPADELLAVRTCRTTF